MNHQEFINGLIPIAKEGYEKYGILPSLCIAQTCLESSFGSKHMGSANNYFGMKAYSSWHGKSITLPTKEWDGEKMITIQGKFRAYDNLEESVRDYQKLIGTSKRYEKVCHVQNYVEATEEVFKAGYATDPNYPKKLQSIIKNYDLDEIDQEILLDKKDWRVKIGLESIDALQKSILTSPNYWQNLIKTQPDFGPLLGLLKKVIDRGRIDGF